MSRRALLLGLIVLAAFVLRGARWQEECASPLALVPTVDELSYDVWGLELAGGDRAPAVPYTAPLQAHHLAVWHRVFRANPTRARDAARLVGALLGVGTVLLTFLLGRRASGSTDVGLIAAALVALHRPLIHLEPTLLRDGPATFATVAAAYVLLRLIQATDRDPSRPAAGWAVTLGLALGVGALVRENLLLIGVAILFGLAARAGSAPKARKAYVLAAGLVGLAALAPLSPWLLANHQLEGSLSPLPTWNGGCVFYLHNRADNLSAGYQAPPFVHGANAQAEARGFAQEAERRAGRRLTPHQVSRFWLTEGLRDVFNNPTLYALKLRARLALFFASSEAAHARDLRDDARRSWVLRVPSPSGFGPLAAFALLGLVTLPRRRPGAWIVAAWVIVFAATTLPVAFTSRYRLPLVPLVSILAAVTWREWALGLRNLTRLGSKTWAPSLSELARALSRRQTDATRSALGVVALGLALTWGLWPVPHDPSANQTKRGIALVELGRFPEAIEELSKPASLGPGALEALARAQLELGRAARAAETYALALEADARRPGAWAGLALAHLALGDRAEARRAIKKALAVDPENPNYAAFERLLNQDE